MGVQRRRRLHHRAGRLECRRARRTDGGRADESRGGAGESRGGAPAHAAGASAKTAGASAKAAGASVKAAGATARSALAAPDNLDLILDIDLPMSVRFGRTELALGALTRLGPGSIIDLGRSPEEPVEVLVSGRVIARGDVVVVGGNYGVRITDLVSPTGARRD